MNRADSGNEDLPSTDASLEPTLLIEKQVRQQVACELRWYLGSLLTAVQAQLSQTLSALEDSALVQRLKNAQAILEGAMEYCRTLDNGTVSRLAGRPSIAFPWLAQLMQRYGLDVTLDLVGGSPTLPENDSVMLYLSLGELLLNVAKHADQQDATVRVETIGGVHRISVIDRGKGFDADLLLEVDGHSKSGTSSLFRIRDRMSALGGRMEVMSKRSQGTTVTLILPAKAHRHGSHETERPMIRVLIVDDHAMVRQGVRTLLEQYSDVTIVAEAADGIEAIELVRKQAPDVVIMDINMPRMNGILATKILNEEHPSIAVIGLSLHQSDQFDRTILEAGAVDYVPKDAAGDDLYKAIRRTRLRQSPTP
jgi:CheY-like chemotaxis protein